jgi:hypothetical protein
MRSNTRLSVLPIAIAIAVVLPFASSASAKTVEPQHSLRQADAAYYLDVRDVLPPSFRQLGPDELAALGAETAPGTTTAAYQSDELDAAVVADVTIGNGRASRTALREYLASVDKFYDAETVQGLFGAESPDGQMTVQTGEWADVDVGDAARATLLTIVFEGEPIGHVELLSMAVDVGDESALVEVRTVFDLVPPIAAVDVAAAIEARLRNGPPSPEQLVARSGLITLADLPPGWQEKTQAPGDTEPTAPGAVPASGTNEGDRAATATKNAFETTPACKRFAPGFATGVETDRPSRSTKEVVEEGQMFLLGAGNVSSRVVVYPDASEAQAFLHLAREPGFKTCLKKAFGVIAVDGVKAALADLPPNARRTLRGIEAKVTTPRSAPIGDDRILFRVSIDLSPTVDITLTLELETVRVGRALAAYTFGGSGDISVRDAAVTSATTRLNATPGVR